ncbi:MAG: isoquinoline 1-oxidoreductase [Betaproteobacteria bacterium TMED41]|nr:MAG: isoquinoline 1-oxidoreductase [Betaproteobacteria bacterium TMED41]
MQYRLNINGKAESISAEPETPLVWVLRDQIGLTGTKFGCGVASCGNCTVHVDGLAVKSCQLKVEQAQDKEITTIEGANTTVASVVREAWVNKNVVQCGYCQSGQIMTAIALLENNQNPSDEEIQNSMAGNACRCMCYLRIKDAVKLASKKLEA